MMNSTKVIRTYSELIRLPTFVERYEYLRLNGCVGKETFGFDRYLNQMFYHSNEWKPIRDYIISRDLGQDLATKGYTIQGSIYIHHMNPVDVKDIQDVTEYLIDPEYLVCTTHNTHNAIHYGDASLLITEPIVRTRYDTCPWKKERRM